MKLGIAYLAAGAMMLVAIPLAAEGIDQREDQQQQRIGEGVANGDLTHHETKRLEHHENKLANTEDRMRDKHDGRLTHHDRRHLNHMANHDSHLINKLDNNNKVQ
jgi:hypothetical protein